MLSTPKSGCSKQILKHSNFNVMSKSGYAPGYAPYIYIRQRANSCKVCAGYAPYIYIRNQAINVTPTKVVRGGFWRGPIYIKKSKN